jgi:hypothetical protein
MMQLHSATPFVRRARQLLPMAVIVALGACAEQPNPMQPENAALMAKAGGPSNLVVVSTLNDGFSIASDGGGDYINGVGAVITHIQPVGDWLLENDARRSTRSTWLDLSDVESGTTPFAAKLVKGRFISKITDAGGTYQAMKLGDTRIVPLSFAFNDGGVQYGLRMNTLQNMDLALATCTASISASDLRCARWELTPTGTDGKNRAQLQNVTAGTNIAVVRMSFHIVFRR